MKLQSIKICAGAVLLTATTSCTVGPDYKAPATHVAPAYAGASPTTQTTAADQATGTTTRPSILTTEADPPSQWWTTLRDPELDKLVRQAGAGNINLQIATSRLFGSRASLRLAGAKELPTVDASGTFARIDSGKNLGSNALSGGAGPPTAIITNVWSEAFDVKWELDLFGGGRRQIEAARADYQASVEDRRNLLISLTAEVAQDYLQLRGLQERLRLARKNLDIQTDTLGLTKSLQKAGFDSQLAVAREQTQVAQTRAGIVPLTTDISRREHAIAILLGMPPDALAAELDKPSPVPAVPALVGIGMPADLLRRRPDLRGAERQIAAANSRVGAAIADFYPKFSLTGDLGLDGTKFKHLFDWESRYFILEPNIDWRVFDFGRTAAEVDQEKAAYQQAVLTYQNTVLTALAEVEDALVAYSNEQDHRAALADAVKAAQDAVLISKDQFKQGTIDFIQVLDSQGQLLAAQDALAQSDQAIATNMVQLYKALGGGWEEDDGRQRRDKPNADVPPAIGTSALLNSAGDDK
jgi:NodT family efflux transporter outer membrane factor (OMF) lipoprotein